MQDVQFARARARVLGSATCACKRASPSVHVRVMRACVDVCVCHCVGMRLLACVCSAGDCESVRPTASVRASVVYSCVMIVRARTSECIVRGRIYLYVHARVPMCSWVCVGACAEVLKRAVVRMMGCTRSCKSIRNGRMRTHPESSLLGAIRDEASVFSHTHSRI